MSFVPSFEHYGTYDESEYPHLWVGRVGAWCPSVNPAGGTRLIDHSHYRNWGTLTNGPTWQTSSGKNALFFDGSDDYVSFNSPFLVPGINSYSINGWINVQTFAAFRGWIYAGGDATVADQRIDVSASGKLLFASYHSGPGANSITLAQTLSTGLWYHVAMVRNSVDMTLRAYINGVQDSSTSLTNATAYYGTGLNVSRIGWLGLTGSYYSNQFSDDVAIYNRALNSEEIRELYMLGRGGAYTPRSRMFYPSPPQQTFLTAWASQANKVIQYGVAT